MWTSKPLCSVKEANHKDHILDDDIYTEFLEKVKLQKQKSRAGNMSGRTDWKWAFDLEIQLLGLMKIF